MPDRQPGGLLQPAGQPVRRALLAHPRPHPAQPTHAPRARLRSGSSPQILFGSTTFLIFLCHREKILKEETDVGVVIKHRLSMLLYSAIHANVLKIYKSTYYSNLCRIVMPRVFIDILTHIY